MSRLTNHEFYDAIIIGGGFFGCCLALSMASRYRRVLVLEKEQDLLSRASYVNQARVHNGYHYPRSLITALRSAFNYPVFSSDFDDCVDRTFLQVYAVARGLSKVTAYQYRTFCERVGIPLRPAPKKVARLFQPDLIEEAFCAEECAFDAPRLRERLRAGMEESGVELACGIEVARILPGPQGRLRVEAGCFELAAQRVFNCTYSGINQLLHRSALPLLPLKHEIAEIAMIGVPPELEQVGITVMDGPFFSTMPFPALNLHSLSHVTYTPHESWNDPEHIDCSQGHRQPTSRSIFMLKDAQRYVPALRNAHYEFSLFETKTVLLKNEIDDGRPILCRSHHGLENLFVVLGAKIDNIYDVLKALDAFPCFPRSRHESRNHLHQNSERARLARTQH
jgi:glycine/D-amino acid oxidase-like deaminating enzyme